MPHQFPHDDRHRHKTFLARVEYLVFCVGKILFPQAQVARLLCVRVLRCIVAHFVPPSPVNCECDRTRELSPSSPAPSLVSASQYIRQRQGNTVNTSANTRSISQALYYQWLQWLPWMILARSHAVSVLTFAAPSRLKLPKKAADSPRGARN